MAKKEQREAQFIVSALNTPMLNYRVYYMSIQEKILNFLLSFVAGGTVGLIFYGGQFRDGDGFTTMATQISNVVIFIVAGIIISIIYFPIRTEQLRTKRRLELTQQFRGLLEALSVALSSGMNMSESLVSALTSLKMEFSDESYIVHEVTEMINGIQNNIPIEDMMASLGERSEIEDIKNFAIVFAVSYRAGGNLKDIVRRTNTIISEKIEINEEIETSLASNKSQFVAMMFIPIALVVLLRVMSSSFASGFATPVGVIAMTVAIGIFIAAYKLGEKIMDIKG